MAFGGIPIYTFATPGARNILFIDGLTLAPTLGGPPNIANPDTGQLTTALPGLNQTGIPNEFAFGRGLWPVGGDRLIFDYTVPVNPGPNLAVAVSLITSPEIIGSNLVITRQNILNQGVAPVRIVIQFLHSLLR